MPFTIANDLKSKLSKQITNNISPQNTPKRHSFLKCGILQMETLFKKPNFKTMRSQLKQRRMANTLYFANKRNSNQSELNIRENASNQFKYSNRTFVQNDLENTINKKATNSSEESVFFQSTYPNINTIRQTDLENEENLEPFERSILNNEFSIYKQRLNDSNGLSTIKEEKTKSMDTNTNQDREQTMTDFDRFTSLQKTNDDLKHERDSHLIQFVNENDK